MEFVNHIMDKLFRKSSEGKNDKFFSLEDCVSKTLIELGIDSMHDKGKFAMEFQGDRCIFNMALNCLEENRLMVYVLFPIPIADDVACAVAYEVKRVAKDVAATMPDIEVRSKKDDEGFSVFACMVKDFGTLTAETPNEIYEEMMRTVNVLDGENFDSLVAAIFGYKSYGEAKQSIRLESVGENDMILDMEDGYYKLLAETPNINCSRYTGRLKIYIQHIIETKENGKEQISFLHIDTFDDYIQEVYNIANDEERDLIRKLRFLMAADDGSVTDLNIGEYEAEYLIPKDPLQLLYYGEDSRDDEDKIDDTEGIIGDSEEERLYSTLSKRQYKEYPYEQRDLGEDMTLVNEDIYGYWKPRYLIDERNKTAVEFMSAAETLMNVTDEDIDWESIKGVSEDVMARIECRSFHFPGFIYDYENGIAKVRWEVNPDGMYFRDEDGFGMTDDDEIDLEGAIDRQGKVVKKFSLKQ